jgi:WD40 repeat protein
LGYDDRAGLGNPRWAQQGCLFRGIYSRWPLWDPTNGKALATLAGHKGGIFEVTFSYDGHWLATASRDKTSKLWNVNSGKEVATLAGHEDFVAKVSFSPDGSQLASASLDGTIKLWAIPVSKKRDK